MAYDVISPDVGYDIIEPETPSAVSGSASPPAASRGYDIIQPETRTSTIDSTINRYAQQYGLDPVSTKALIWQESNFNPNAGGAGAGAVGLGQFIPSTWQGVARQMGEEPGDRRDADTSIRRLAFHIADLKKKLGSEDLAFAAYKGGEGAVRRAGGIPTRDQRGGYDPYVDETTEDYVKKILARAARLRSGERPKNLSAIVGQQGPSYDIISLDPTEPEGFSDIPGSLEIPEDKKSVLRKSADVALKAAEWLNAVNAGAWAGVGALFGDEEFKTLYNKYQEQGNPIAIAAKSALRESGIDNKWALMAAGIVGDIVGDPLTYIGVGALTKTGRAAKAAQGLSKVAGSSKKIKSLNNLLIQMAPEARKLAPTLAEQASLGQRQLFSFAGKGIKGEAALKAFDKAGEFLRPVAAPFSSAAKLKDPAARRIFGESVKEGRRLKGYFKDIMAGRAAEIDRLVKNLPAGDRAFVTEIIEDPRLYDEAVRGMHGKLGDLAIKSDEAQQFIKALTENNPEALQAIGAGNLVGKWVHEVPTLGGDVAASKGSLPRYFGHVIPEEARGALTRKVPSGASEFSENVGNEIARKLTDAEGLPAYTIKQINEMAELPFNDLVKAGVPKKTAGKIVKLKKTITDYYESPTALSFSKKRPEAADALFSTNPGFILKNSGDSGAKAIGGAAFRQGIGAGLGKTADDVAARPDLYSDWVRVDKWKGKKEGGLFFAPEVSDEINRLEGAFFGDDVTKGAVKAFDTFQNFWKSWTLSPFPGYHNRNFMSAVFNNVEAGLYDPRYYLLAKTAGSADSMARGGLSSTQAMKTWAGLIPDNLQESIRAGNKAKGLDTLKKVRLKNGMTAEEAVNLARQNGIRGQSLHEAEFLTGGADIGETLGETLKHPKSLASTRGPVIRAGRRVGAAVEDDVRLALFFKKLDDGFAPAAAADEVMKFQFDYGDISPFEKNVMARVFPFYRFTRFNVPLQMQQAIQKPGFFAGVEKVRKQVNVEQDLPLWKESLLQDYMAANLPIQMGTKEVNGKVVPRLFAFGNWLPNYTALSNTAHPMETILGLVSPFLKVPLEQAVNQDFFRKGPIVDPKRGKFVEPFFNVPIPARAKHVVKNIRILNEVDRQLGSMIQLVAPGSSNYVLRSGYKPDVVNNAVRLLTGVTLSPFAAEQAQTSKIGKLRAQLREVQSGFRQATRKGDDANAQESYKRLLEIVEQIATLANLTRNPSETEQQ